MTGGKSMTHGEKRVYLIKYLLEEGNYEYEIPADEARQRQLLRGLMNVRPPRPIGEDFLKVQDAYLGELLAERGVVDVNALTPVEGRLYLWRGDITRLNADAIVNAANSGMTGCYQPNHSCIDNVIHTMAGVQLRLKCAMLMTAQGYPEPTGQAKLTPAYNLPSRYVMHTVGTICPGGVVTPRNVRELESCYRACMALADESALKSIAFCCISTGVFGFPQRRGAEVAVRTVKAALEVGSGVERVIFNVFKPEDEEYYRAILGK